MPDRVPTYPPCHARGESHADRILPSGAHHASDGRRAGADERRNVQNACLLLERETDGRAQPSRIREGNGIIFGSYYAIYHTADRRISRCGAVSPELSAEKRRNIIICRSAVFFCTRAPFGSVTSGSSAGSLCSAPPFWLAYNLLSRAYGSAVGDLLSMVSIAMIKYRNGTPAA